MIGEPKVIVRAEVEHVAAGLGFDLCALWGRNLAFAFGEACFFDLLQRLREDRACLFVHVHSLNLRTTLGCSLIAFSNDSGSKLSKSTTVPTPLLRMISQIMS